MNKLTREQAAIIGAYTGTLCGPFEDVHDLADKHFPGIMTIGLAMHAEKIKEKVTPAFMELVAVKGEK